MYLALDPSTTQPWNDDVMRDARNIGHYGLGDTEFTFRDVQQFDELKTLIKTAYDERA